MKEIIDKIDICCKCDLCFLEINKTNETKGYGKLLPFFIKDFKNKIMLVGLNPSYRRFPGIYQAFGGDVQSEGTGWKFISLLKELNLSDKIYLTNLIKCSCLDNEPKLEHYDKCFPIFKKEIEIINPPYIVALGRKVYNYLKKNTNKKVKYLPHPCAWISYNRYTKKQYSQLLCKTIKNTQISGQLKLVF